MSHTLNPDAPPQPENCSPLDTHSPSPCPPPGSENTSTPTIPSSKPPPTPTAPSPSDPTPSSPPTLAARTIPISDILCPADQHGRFDLQPAEIALLAQAIQGQGLINPITVKPEGGRFILIAGRRRLEAHKLLHRTTIECRVTATSDRNAAVLTLAENTQRSNLTPIEEALQLGNLLAQTDAGVDQIALELGRPANWILDRLDLLEYPDNLRQYIHTRRITLSAAKHLCRIEPPEERHQRIEDAAHHGCSAATAALWRQQSDSYRDQDHGPSENANPQGQTEYATQTQTKCFGCQTWVDLTETHPHRLCNKCFEQISGAQAAQETAPTEPPTRSQ